jgi:integrase
MESNDFQANKLKFLELSNLSEATKKAYLSKYLNFIYDIEIDLNKDLFEFNQEDINKYLDRISKKGKSSIYAGASFINNYIQWYSNFYKLPKSNFILNSEQREKESWYISKENLFSICKEMLNNNVAVATLIPLIFARYGILGKEAINMRRLKWKDIDFNNDVIIIRNDKNESVTKIPIDDEFFEYLLDLKYYEKETYKNKEIVNKYIIKGQIEKNEIINYASLNTKCTLSFKSINMKRISLRTLFNCMLVDYLKESYSNKKLTSNDDFRDKLSMYYPNEVLLEERIIKIKRLYVEVTGDKETLRLENCTESNNRSYRRGRSLKRIKEDKDLVTIKHNCNTKNDNTTNLIVLCNNKEYKVSIDLEDFKKVKKYRWYLHEGDNKVITKIKTNGIFRISHLANYILDINERIEVLHKNDDILDYRKNNLIAIEGLSLY